MDFNPTLNDVLYTPRQWAIKQKLYKLLDELAGEYRKIDPEFSFSALRAYDFVQGMNGVNILRISEEIDLELRSRLRSIAEQLLDQNPE